MTREARYMAATPGRQSNQLYVDVEPEPPPAEASHGPQERQSARQMLMSVAHRGGTEASAHQVMASEWADTGSLARLREGAREPSHSGQLGALAESVGRRRLTCHGGGHKTPLAEWDQPVSPLDNLEPSGPRVGTALFKLVAIGSVRDDPAAALQAVLRNWEGPPADALRGPDRWWQGWSPGPKARGRGPRYGRCLVGAPWGHRCVARPFGTSTGQAAPTTMPTSARPSRLSTASGPDVLGGRHPCCQAWSVRRRQDSQLFRAPDCEGQRNAGTTSSRKSRSALSSKGSSIWIIQWETPMSA